MQSAPADDPYRLLGVHPRASADEIRAAYRLRAMRWHPDRNPSPHAEETFKRIRVAYELLRDPRRRADYDASVDATAKREPRRAAKASPPSAPAMPDVRRRVAITLDEQLAGCRVELRVARTEHCRSCRGSGVVAKPARCRACNGTGRSRLGVAMFPFFPPHVRRCASCSGDGVVRVTCGSCGGKGAIGSRGRLAFDVPAGMPPGGTLRIRGHGRRARDGKRAGDLVVQIDIEPHPLFESAFPDLCCDLPVSVFRALAGGSVDVPTLELPVAAKLPADVRDGTELRVAGAGMRNGADGRRGDLIVRLRVVTPRTLSDQQRELLVKLDRLTTTEHAFADWARRRDRAAHGKRGADKRAA